MFVIRVGRATAQTVDNTSMTNAAPSGKRYFFRRLKMLFISYPRLLVVVFCGRKIPPRRFFFNITVQGKNTPLTCGRALSAVRRKLAERAPKCEKSASSRSGTYAFFRKEPLFFYPSGRQTAAFSPVFIPSLPPLNRRERLPRRGTWTRRRSDYPQAEKRARRPRPFSGPRSPEWRA